MAFVFQNRSMHVAVHAQHKDEGQVSLFQTNLKMYCLRLFALSAETRDVYAFSAGLELVFSSSAASTAPFAFSSLSEL